MHLEIDEKTFALHLGRVQYAIVGKSAQLICTALTIEATPERVVFKACDLGMEIVSVVDPETVTVLTPGTISIIERDIPKLYGLQSIQVPPGSEQAWFFCTTGKTRVGLLKGADYPKINFTAEQTIILSSSVLAEGFEAVEFSASRDEYKQTWASVYMQVQENLIQFIAGESQRMALYSCSCEQKMQPSSSMIASAAIRALISFLKTEEGNIEIAFQQSGGLVRFQDSRGGYIICRTLAGNYPGATIPRYIEAIPQREDALKRAISFSVPDMLRVLEILEPSATAASNRLKIQVNYDDQAIKLWAVADGKESFQQIPAVVGGTDLEICINFSYLLANLRNLKDKEGVLELFGSNLPCFLRPSSDSDKEFVILTALMSPAAV